MLRLLTNGPRLCDKLTRREMLRIGGIGALGLSLPALLSASTGPIRGSARRCIVLFLMGGPPQHSTWDPKPDATPEVRGPFGPIATSVPGIQICELMPRLAQRMDKIAILRAVSTGDSAHSSSGYYMMTGIPHAPQNVENANPGAPNNWPTLGAIVQKARAGERRLIPAAVRLPHRIFNTDGSVWPGQDSGFLGQSADPWLLRCEPGAATMRVSEFSLAADLPSGRLDDRHRLLHAVNQQLQLADRVGQRYDRNTQQAFDMLRSAEAGHAFDLEREPPAMRERYGRSPFGQSVLLSRRLVEAGVSLVQVNWYRGPNEPSDNPCWDSHTDEPNRLRNVLVPPMDHAFAALIDDLEQRGLLDETLIVCMAEFGRTPRYNARTGRDHWGPVFSVALAGAGIRGGTVYGASDRIGAQPRDGRVRPEDLTATIFHCLGFAPDTEIHDSFNRPIPLSRGQIIRQVVH
ncbi:MAG: DUF1501 domain-containing protein [Planctomycetes bacterium]|nr:DUF1501 domain-containing protein [Planctomycetota bacterium]